MTLLPQKLCARQTKDMSESCYSYSVRPLLSYSTRGKLLLDRRKHPHCPRIVLSKLGCEALTCTHLAQGTGWVEEGRLWAQKNSMVSHPEPLAAPACHLACCLLALSCITTSRESEEGLHAWDLHLLSLDLLPERISHVIAS